MPWVSAIVLVPIVGALIMLMVPPAPQGAGTAKLVAILASGGTLVLTAILVGLFDRQDGHMQYVDHVSWVEQIGLSWDVGVDGISLWLLVLTAGLFLLGIIAAVWRAPAERPGRRSAICPFGPRSPSRTGAADARTSSTASRPAATTRRSRSSSSVRTPPSTPCNTPQRAAGFSVPLALQGLFGGRRRRGPIEQPPHTAPAGYGGRALKCNARIVDSRDVGGMLPPRNLTSGDVPARA